MFEFLAEDEIKTIDPQEMMGNYGTSTKIWGDAHDPHEVTMLNKEIVFSTKIMLKIHLSKIDPNELDMMEYLNECEKMLLFKERGVCF